MKTTITEFQRAFRTAREAADRGESVVVEGEGKKYVFEVLPPAQNPFAEMTGVFGTVALGKSKTSAREKIRTAVKKKYRR